MKKSSFLNKLKKNETLKLVEPSEEISKSYLIKSDKCIKVAELAYKAGIYENALTEAYYSIYNTVMALFFKCGIKCENHSASVILIKELFDLEDLFKIFSELKKDRIDNQYYVSTLETEPVEKEKCNEKINLAQEFNLKLGAYIENLTDKNMNKFRELFEKL